MTLEFGIVHSSLTLGVKVTLKKCFKIINCKFFTTIALGRYCAYSHFEQEETKVQEVV